MFDNVELNVVIGLALIYLLYGLLITILGEITASRMGFRQRMLRLCIERMLNDSYYDHGRSQLRKQWNNILRFFLFEFHDFKYSVAGRFYQDPAIKYLAKGEKTFWLSFKHGKPSYIKRETFALTLIHLMRDKGMGSTDMEKVEYCLKYNTMHFQRETIKNIRAMSVDSRHDILVFGEKLKTWFNESMDRNNGWYTRMMRGVSFFLGLSLAMIFNVDSIKIARILSRDKEARGQLVNLAIGLSKDTLLTHAYGSGSGQSANPDALVDSSLAHVSRDIGLANYVLGLGWEIDQPGNPLSDTVYENKDSIGFRNLCSYRKNAEKVDTMRRKIKEADLRRQPLLRRISLQQAIYGPQAAARAQTSQADARSGKVLKRSQQLKSDADTLMSLTDRSNSLRLILILDTLRGYDALSGPINTMTGKEFSTITGIRIMQRRKMDSFAVIDGFFPYCFTQKVHFIFSSIFDNWIRFLGFLLTAIALSLGAPFWFDVLSKIVAIRGGGISPITNNSQDKADPLQVIPLINVPYPGLPSAQPPPLGELAQAVMSAKSFLMTVAGVLSVDEGMIGKKGSKKDAIEVHVGDKNAGVSAKAILGDNFLNFPVNILITAQAKVHILQSGDTIMNQEVNVIPLVRNNGTGSLGCFLKKENSAAEYLLSCWHVLKGDWDWNSHGGPDIIMDSGRKNIGRLVDGCLSVNMDVGFAELNDKGFKNVFSQQWRAIGKEDVNQQMPVKFHGSNSGPATAYIFNASVTISAGLEYPDGVLRVLTDMISITNLIDGSPKSPSHHGDSGALVLDKDDIPVGIVVGGDDMFTYVAKFSNILAEDGMYKEYKLLI